MWRAMVGQRPRYDLIATTLASRRTKVLTRALRDPARPLLFDRPVWAPDGKEIAFTLERGEHAGSVANATDIHLLELSTGHIRRLTTTGDAFAPVWSTNGNVVAFSRRQMTSGFAASLWAVDLRTGKTHEILRAPPGHGDVPSSWSPDGEWLAFTRYGRSDSEARSVSDSSVYIVRADGSGLRKLNDKSSDASWSPDGSKIAFASYRHVGSTLSYGDASVYENDLYLMNSDGSGVTRVTATRLSTEAAPSWSPDGKHLAVQVGEVTGNALATHVVVISVVSRCTFVVADSGSRMWYAKPAWQPGGHLRERPCRP